MKKYLSVLVLGLVFAGAGCVPVKPVVTTPPNNTPSASTIPAGWSTFVDTVRGYSVSYSGTGLTDSGAPIDLPAATGNKGRKMSLQFGPVTEKLDKDGCLPLVIEPSVKKSVVLNGIPFCIQATDEGAAGSTYRTYNYTTTVGKQIVSLQFLIRYLNSVRIVGGCEQDPDQSKGICKDLVFDPIKDTALFDQIAATFVLSK